MVGKGFAKFSKWHLPVPAGRDVVVPGHGAMVLYGFRPLTTTSDHRPPANYATLGVQIPEPWSLPRLRGPAGRLPDTIHTTYGEMDPPLSTAAATAVATAARVSTGPPCVRFKAPQCKTHTGKGAAAEKEREACTASCTLDVQCHAWFSGRESLLQCSGIEGSLFWLSRGEVQRKRAVLNKRPAARAPATPGATGAAAAAATLSPLVELPETKTAAATVHGTSGSAGSHGGDHRARRPAGSADSKEEHVPRDTARPRRNREDKDAEDAEDAGDTREALDAGDAEPSDTGRSGSRVDGARHSRAKGHPDGKGPSPRTEERPRDYWEPADICRLIEARPELKEVLEQWPLVRTGDLALLWQFAKLEVRVPEDLHVAQVNLAFGVDVYPPGPGPSPITGTLAACSKDRGSPKERTTLALGSMNLLRSDRFVRLPLPKSVLLEPVLYTIVVALDDSGVPAVNPLVVTYMPIAYRDSGSTVWPMTFMATDNAVLGGDAMAPVTGHVNPVGWPPRPVVRDGQLHPESLFDVHVSNTAALSITRYMVSRSHQGFGFKCDAEWTRSVDGPDRRAPQVIVAFMQRLRPIHHVLLDSGQLQAVQFTLAPQVPSMPAPVPLPYVMGHWA